MRGAGSPGLWDESRSVATSANKSRANGLRLAETDPLQRFTLLPSSSSTYRRHKKAQL
jgi:hypothetical protein